MDLLLDFLPYKVKDKFTIINEEGNEEIEGLEHYF